MQKDVRVVLNNILALDQASRTSGYAVFQEEKLIVSGTFTYDDDDFSLRLVKIRNKVISLIEQYNINKILLEDIQLQGQTNNVETYRKLAEVRGVLSELACEMKIPHEIIHSQTWKSTLGIKGRDRATQKRNAQAYVTQAYNKKVSQDESDAICIGTHYILSNKSAF